MSETNAAADSDASGASEGTGVSSISPEGASDKPSGGVEGAFARAKANIAKREKASGEVESGATEEQSGSEESASTEQAGESASTPEGGETETTASDDPDATASPEGDDDEPQASTVSAPEQWPAEQKAKFGALPSEAQEVVLDIEKSFQQGYTKVTQQMAQLQTEFGEIGQQMQSAGLDGNGLKELVATHTAFAQDPEGVIERLAEGAGIQVTIGEAIPEFESQADMAKWVADQATKKAQRQTDKAEREAQAQLQQQQAQQTFKSELAEAQKRPGFKERQGDVLATLKQYPNLSVAQADKLVSYDSLEALAKEGQQAKAELQQLQAKQQETAKKKTSTPKAKESTEMPEGYEKWSPAKRAMHRAKLNRKRGLATALNYLRL